MLSSKQRATLRKHANTLQPVYLIGKDGIDQALVNGVNECINARELIKLKLLETCPLAPKEAAAELCEKTNSESVQIIGSKIVLYKQKKEESKFAQYL